MPAHIGLIGGIGPAATDYYYRKIIAAYADSNEELELTIVHADTPTLLDNLQRDRRQTQVEIYRRLTDRLKTAGADFVVVTSIAGHFCIEDFKSKSPLPVIDLIEAVREEVQRKGFSSLGILGTETVMKSKFFGGLGGTRLVTPTPALLADVHAAYVSMAASGSVTHAQRETFNKACVAFIDGSEVDSILMAGTDLALVYDEDSSPFPVVDCAAIHARKVVLASLEAV